MQQTYSGGCQCGAVRYEATFELGEVLSCNCSRCGRLGSLLAFMPKESFKLVSGDGALTEYQFNKHNIHHLFCATCGIQSFAHGKGPGGAEMVAVNVRCLDGALGAYEWGAIEALFARMDELERKIPITLKVVTGVSIGAINGACIVGAKGAHEAERRKKGLGQLAELWNDLKLETPFGGRHEMPFGLPSLSPARDMSLLGLPGFYAPRSDVWNVARWTSIYDTSPLKATLDDHICFKAIDTSETGFIVTAVDVERGTLRRFRNEAGRQKRPQRPEEDDVVVPFTASHIMASGSLAPQFPWTKIDTQLYWDGGIVDNTPLGDAMEAFSDDDKVYRLLVVMNLYPLTGKEPKNLLSVADRVHELSYGNRVRQDRAAARRINKLVRTIEGLRKVAKDAGLALSPKLEAEITYANRFKIAKTVEIDLQTPGEGQARVDDEAGLRDFSPATIDDRRCRGRERAVAAITEALIKDEFLTPKPAAPARAPTET